jgi:hypothetical protein
MSEITPFSSIGHHVHHLWHKLLDLGPYAGTKFAEELTAKSTVALDLLETYAKLDPELTNAFGTIPPKIWRVK